MQQSNTKLSSSEDSIYYDMIWFYRRYPIQAARDLLGIRLSIHQGLALKMLWNGAPSVVLFCGRGTAKTFLLGLYAVLICMLFPNEKVVCVGSGFRQSKEIIQEASEKIINSELASQENVYFARKSVKWRQSKSIINKSPDAWRIDFLNGSFIVAVPLSKSGDSESGGGGNNIRGYRASKLLIDETKDIPSHIISRVLEPMGAVLTDPVGDVDTGENQTVFAGTIDFESNHFWDIILQHQKSSSDPNDDYHEDRDIVSFNYQDTFWVDKSGNRRNWTIPYRMAIKKILRARDSGDTPEEDWNAEYLCIPIRNTGTYFPYTLMTTVFDYLVTSDPDKAGADDQYLMPKLLDHETPVAIGVDVGRVDDFFTIVVVALNQMDTRAWSDKKQCGNNTFNHVIYAFEGKSMTYIQQAIKLREILKRFPNFQKIAIDARGGEALLDELAFNVPRGEEPIFDPEDEDRVLKLDGGVDGITAVVKIVANERLNNEWNSFLKAQFEYDKLYIPKPLARHKVSEMEDIYSCMTHMKSQFIKLKTKVSAQTNQFRFFMDNPKKNKKDLYSALLYAMAGVKGTLQSEEMTEDQPAHAAYL